MKSVLPILFIYLLVPTSHTWPSEIAWAMCAGLLHPPIGAAVTLL